MIHPEYQQWRLDTPQQSLVLSSENAALPTVIYWGSSLPAAEDLTALMQMATYDINGGSLDQIAPLSVCPQASEGFPGQAGMALRDAQGKALWTNFCFKEQTLHENDLVLRFHDENLGITYQLDIVTDTANNLFTLSAKLFSDPAIYIDWLAAPVLPAPQNSDHTLEFSGRWCGEFQLNIAPWSAGCRLRENLLGRTSHEHFPGLIMPTTNADNNSGSAYGLHYGFSGGHKMLTEELSDGRRQVQFGHPTQSDRKLTNSFETAPLYASYSAVGLNGLARSFQGHLRSAIVNFPDANKPRPVHYNCWEAVYFDHDIDVLKDIAARAASIGAERFVLDDGWFKKRHNDLSSLGDWVVDKAKFPQGLHPLIQHIHSLQMGFGLWFEPEMVSEDSDLYRSHPDWVLGPLHQVQGRQQLVLNMSLLDVQNYLFTQISTLLSEYPIEYIKWDHNRVLPVVDAAQTQGVYSLLDRLRIAHPNVEIESCSSGGGRADFEILKRTHRLWLSDSNDALERFWMQNNAALFFPSEVTGSHIGPAHCHTSGRELPIAFRAWVAASRHMGFEMDPRELSDVDITIIKEAADWYKANRHWLHNGFIQRLDCDDKAVLGEIQLAADDSQFVAFIAQMEVSAQTLPRPVRLCGLETDSMYNISLRNPQDRAPTSRGAPVLKEHNITLSGQYLMQRGISLPVAFPATLWIIEGIKA
ncbi:MAG: alpha-galactosidase [Oceanospirillaceae bacterium]|nr:alpha-galactosidase [Oceanospirillaceae bacterium]